MTVKDLIEGSRFTVAEISIGSVHSIIRNQLEFQEVSVQWIPHLLRADQKNARVQVSCFLLICKMKGRLFCNIRDVT